MLAQGVGHFVAHDHGDLIVGELQLLDDAGEKAILPPGMQNAFTSSLRIKATAHCQLRARSFHA